MGQLRRLAWVSAQAGTRRFFGDSRQELTRFWYLQTEFLMKDGKNKE